MVIDTEEYNTKMREQLQNPLHYDKLSSEPSSDHVEVISNWANRWLEKGQINDDIVQQAPVFFRLHWLEHG